ncbi:GbpC/Spa domain-containing protein [Enterococcus faecalis]|uniref:GbpC/Spa domain-containing protein n=1 Tax=Enterococcus faecalis TaxID=1351 RepID=UPI002453B364|nr:GbpC/Spa domain-containing protein [Enterococcus faecalis]MDH4720572.1 GbpC/Spa domain-containing protein [Enterococcus faecalis]
MREQLIIYTLDAVKRLGIGGNDKSIIDQYNTSALTDSDLTRTDPYSNSQDQIILMKVGDTVTATYDNLSNTSYTQDGSSKKIAKIVYTYTLKSSSNKAQTAIVDIIRDPTVTITVGSNTETNNPISRWTWELSSIMKMELQLISGTVRLSLVCHH